MPDDLKIVSTKATLAYGPATGGPRVASMTATLAGGSGELDAPIAVDLAEESEALGETLWAAASPQTLAQHAKASLAAAARSTVLPRRRKSATGEQGVVENRARFDRMRVLGQGGMGEVALVRDNDIRRTVAVKYLRAENAADHAALLRFADEIRVVGQLEHPAIVPVYDVGVDDQGQHFLVMKHLQGETMEAIIERLKADDPATVARFTYEYRAHLFLQILDAMRYAHSRGVIHRDLKPANIMIGQYGEVTVMDWGIAKPIGRKDPPADASVRATVDSNTGRLLETQIGTLAGTPLYMSPEQAAGRNDELDERSDVYALSVVFYEWMVLEHPIEKPGTLLEILGTIATQEPDHDALGGRGLVAGVPAEFLRFIRPGLEKDPKKRFSSVAEMEKKLRDILDGRIAVACHLTLTKRGAHEFIHWVDRHPKLYSLLFVGTIATLALSLIGGIGAAIYHWLG